MFVRGGVWQEVDCFKDMCCIVKYLGKIEEDCLNLCIQNQEFNIKRNFIAAADIALNQHGKLLEKGMKMLDTYEWYQYNPDSDGYQGSWDCLEYKLPKEFFTTEEWTIKDKILNDVYNDIMSNCYSPKKVYNKTGFSQFTSY